MSYLVKVNGDWHFLRASCFTRALVKARYFYGNYPSVIKGLRKAA